MPNAYDYSYGDMMDGVELQKGDRIAPLTATDFGDVDTTGLQRGDRVAPLTTESLDDLAQQIREYRNPAMQEIELGSFHPIEVDEPTYRFIQNHLATFTDRNAREQEEIRVASALSYSRNLNIPFTAALENLDEISQTWNGWDYKPTPTNFRAIVDSFEIGRLTFDYGMLGDRLRDTVDPAEREAIMAQAMELQAQIEGMQDSVPRNIFIELMKLNAQTAYFTVRSVAAGFAESKIAGAAAGLLGANPALAALIASVSAVHGSFRVSNAQAGGAIYLDLLQNGVEENIAKGISQIAGPINAAIEVGLDGLTGAWLKALGIPVQSFTSKLLSRMLSKGTLGKIGRFATNVAVGSAMEGLEEGFQGISDLFFEDLAYTISDSATEKPDWNIVRNFASDFSGGFLGSLLLGLPANAINTSADFRTVQQMENAAFGIRSREAFYEATDGLKLEGMTDEDWRTVQDRAFEKGTQRSIDSLVSRVDEAFNTTLAGRETGVTPEQETEGAEGESIADGYTAPQVVRMDNGALHSQDDTLTRFADGSTLHSMRFGNPNDGSVLYGQVQYRSTPDGVLEIESVRTAKGLEALQDEMLSELTSRYPDMDIQWTNTRSASETSLRDRLIGRNPRGSQYGLNWSSRRLDTQDHAKVASRLGNIFSEDEAVNAGLATVVQLIGARYGMTGEAFLDRYIPQIRRWTREQQEAAGGSRGMTEFFHVVDGIQATIYAGENADPTTFIHEMSHVLRRIGDTGTEFKALFDRYRNDADFQRYVQNSRIIREKDLASLFTSDDWTVQDEEFFAELVEDYFTTGRSANSEVGAFFRRIADWFRQVYRSLRNTGRLNDEVSSFIDNLFGMEGAGERGAQRSTQAAETTQTAAQSGVQTDTATAEASAASPTTAEATLDDANAGATPDSVDATATVDEQNAEGDLQANPDMLLISKPKADWSVRDFRDSIEELSGVDVADILLTGDAPVALLRKAGLVNDPTGPNPNAYSIDPRFNGLTTEDAQKMRRNAGKYAKALKSYRTSMKRISASGPVQVSYRIGGVLYIEEAHVSPSGEFSPAAYLAKVPDAPRNMTLSVHSQNVSASGGIPALPNPEMLWDGVNTSTDRLMQGTIEDSDEWRNTEAMLKENATNFDAAGNPLAPNGQLSKLPYREWVTVRTPSFLNWFGDWMNDPENASKVVDENGEPMVVYHGTGSQFSEFSYDELGPREGSFFFAQNREDAEGYSGGYLMSVFLNIRNPISFNDIPAEVFDATENKAGMVEWSKQQGYDGWITDIEDGWGELSAFYPNQIKSIENVGTFSTESNDILYQLSPEYVRENMDYPTKWPQDPEFREIVDETPGMKIEYDGYVLDLERWQKPEQDNEASVRTGVFYLPHGASQARYYRTGGISNSGLYGGSVNFRGKTLLKAPLVVQGSTGGRVPLKAYEALFGKEAAEKLEADCESIMRPYQRSDKVQRAMEVYYEYLPEADDDYMDFATLETNSRDGNQLRYAVQENIIAHALREAGYDSVIGYNRHKITEIFDVREGNYPSETSNVPWAVFTPSVDESSAAEASGNSFDASFPWNYRFTDGYEGYYNAIREWLPSTGDALLVFEKYEYTRLIYENMREDSAENPWAVSTFKRDKGRISPVGHSTFKTKLEALNFVLADNYRYRPQGAVLFQRDIDTPRTALENEFEELVRFSYHDYGTFLEDARAAGYEDVPESELRALWDRYHSTADGQERPVTLETPNEALQDPTAKDAEFERIIDTDDGIRSYLRALRRVIDLPENERTGSMGSAVLTMRSLVPQMMMNVINQNEADWEPHSLDVVRGYIRNYPGEFRDLYARATGNSYWLDVEALPADLMPEVEEGLSAEADTVDRRTLAASIDDPELKEAVLKGTDRYGDMGSSERLQSVLAEKDAEIANAEAELASLRTELRALERGDDSAAWRKVASLDRQIQRAQEQLDRLTNRIAEQASDRFGEDANRRSTRLVNERSKLASQISQLMNQQAAYIRQVDDAALQEANARASERIQRERVRGQQRAFEANQRADQRLADERYRNLWNRELDRREQYDAITEERWKAAKRLNEERQRSEQRLSYERYKASVREDRLRDRIDRANDRTEEAIVRERWIAAKRLNETRKRYDQKLKDLKALYREREAVRRVKQYKQTLYNRIMRKPSANVAVEYANQILAIQAMVDTSQRKTYRVNGQAWDAETFKQMFRDTPNDPVFAALRPSYLDSLMKEDITNWSISQLEDLANAVQMLREEGLRERNAYLTTQRANVKTLRSQLLDDLIDGPQYREPPRTGTKEERGTRRERAKRLGNDLYYATINITRKVLKLDGGKKGRFYELLVEQRRRHQDAETRAIRKRMLPITKLMKDLGVNASDLYRSYTLTMDGKPFTVTMSQLGYIYFSPGNERNRAALAYGTLISNVEKDRIVSEVDESGDYGDTVQERALRWAEINKRVQEMGDQRFQEVWTQARDILMAPEHANELKVIQAVVDDLNSDSFSRIVDLMRRVYNVEVQREQFYLPMNRTGLVANNPQESIKNDLLNTIPEVHPNVNRGFTESRIDISPMRQSQISYDLFGLWDKSVFEQEHTIEYLEYVRQLNAIFVRQGSQSLRETIESSFGKGMLRDIDDYITRIANPRAYNRQQRAMDRFIRVLRGALYPAYLGWRASSVVLQAITSPAPFLGGVKNPAYLLKGYLQLILHPLETCRAVAELSPFMASRSFDQNIEWMQGQLGFSDISKARRFLLRMNDIGMQGMEWVDRFAVSGGWMGIYMEQMDMIRDSDRGDTMTEAEISAEAARVADAFVRDTQPHSDTAELSPLFTNRSEAEQAFTQFGASLNFVWQNVTFDIPQAFKNHEYGKAIGMMTGYMLAGVLLYMVQEGLGGDDDDDKEDVALWREIAYAALTQPVSGIPLLSGVVDGLMQQVFLGDAPWFWDASLDPFPLIDRGISALRSTAKGNWPSAFDNALDAILLGSGLPYSGGSELMEMFGYDGLSEIFGIGTDREKPSFHPEVLLGRDPSED